MDQQEKEMIVNDIIKPDSFMEEVWNKKPVEASYEDMSWGKILKITRIDKWMDTEDIEFNKILGKKLLVVDYEITDFEKDDGTVAYTLYLLLQDRSGNKRKTHTSAKIPVDIFRNHSDDVKKRIDAHVPIMFTKRISSTGNSYIVVAD